jgi:hypothetical protein
VGYGQAQNQVKTPAETLSLMALHPCSRPRKHTGDQHRKIEFPQVPLIQKISLTMQLIPSSSRFHWDDN